MTSVATQGARQEAVVAAIRRGLPRRMAASLAGINHTTFYDWLNNIPTFASAIENAEAEHARELVASVELAGNIHNEKTGQLDWRAHAWLMERRYPNEFARREQVSMVGAQGGPIEISHLTDEQVPVRLKQVAQLLLESGELELLEDLGLSNGHTNGHNGSG